MNQDQVKALLVSIEDAPLDFTVIFSGKQSRKVNGLYKAATREIILHNKNFSDTNLLIYTAIHEYAHHLHSCKRGGTLSVRAHTSEFWALFHNLLEKAEKKQLYSNAYHKSEKLNTLTATIRDNYITKNGRLFMELGGLLIDARALCEEAGLRFEDYIDRILCLPRLAARLAIKSFSLDLDPALGQDNMRLISSIAGGDDRRNAQKALLSGKSPDSVKMALRASLGEEDPRQQLEKEKGRLIRTIDTLSARLREVENKLAGTQKNGAPDNV